MENSLYDIARTLFEDDPKLKVADLLPELNDAYKDARSKDVPAYQPIAVENRHVKFDGTVHKANTRREYEEVADESTM